jgi:hypothetical protein
LGRWPNSPSRARDSALEAEAETVRQCLQALGEEVGLKPAEVFCYAASAFHKQIPYKQALNVERALTEVRTAFGNVNLDAEKLSQLDGLLDRWRALHQQFVAKSQRTP